ncbi:MAG TPA: MBL fold metallo-hydrolase [Terriglobales bacterium]|nr:MBL fold metallo-hydrolase [Terriglobales bacterium]
MHRFALLLAALGLFVGAGPSAAPPRAPLAMFTLHQVAPHVWAAIDAPHSPAGANAGFIVGTRAILVVDTFEDAGAARQLLGAIGKISPLPIRYVVNTHYHLDHVQGNAVFAAAGATIFAQTNVRGWIHSDNLKFFGPHPTAAQRARVAALKGPDVTYGAGVSIDLGGITAEVAVRPGHTGGDSIVVVPSDDIVFTGDLLWNHMLPNLIDASTAPLIGSLDGLAHDHPRATFIPGHGAIAHVSDIAALTAFLTALRRDIAAAEQQGVTGTALVQQVEGELQPGYGQWGLWTQFAARDITLTDEELRGVKPLPH